MARSGLGATTPTTSWAIREANPAAGMLEAGALNSPRPYQALAKLQPLPQVKSTAWRFDLMVQFGSGEAAYLNRSFPKLYASGCPTLHTALLQFPRGWSCLTRLSQY